MATPHSRALVLTRARTRAAHAHAGVTRDSIIQLARRLGYDVQEEPVSVTEAMEADEVFTTGARVLLMCRACVHGGSCAARAASLVRCQPVHAQRHQPPPCLPCDHHPAPAPSTGTAVVVSSVGSLTYKGKRRAYVEDGAAGSTALELYNALTQLQTGQAQDPFGWVYKVC
jgi:hypothetical protein